MRGSGWNRVTGQWQTPHWAVAVMGPTSGVVDIRAGSRDGHDGEMIGHSTAARVTTECHVP
jgi:hypothetical protein